MKITKRIAAFLLIIALLMPLTSALGVTYYRVNTSWLKARSEPSFNARVMDSYRRDFAVTIDRNLSGGWAKVRFRPSGKQAYVQKQYLTACKRYTAYVTDSKTNLRSGPATSFESKGQLKKGTKVTVLTHGAAFDYVSTPKGKGYIRNSFLSTKKPK
jgi:uncharacterized protein YgiM (DUF1202 family)